MCAGGVPASRGGPGRDGVGRPLNRACGSARSWTAAAVLRGFAPALLAAVTLSPGLPAQSLSALDDLFDAPPFDGMHVGALVVDVETGERLYARNGGKRFAPASNQKLLTTIAALERLGPDYRFRTSVSAMGVIGPEGVLVGDLLVEGTGDPTLSDRYHDDAEAPLRDLAEQLWAAGLRQVRGDLIVDAVAWDSKGIEGTWMWGDLPYGYAAVGGPFVVAEGMARVEARAGAVGDPVEIRWWPVGDPGRFTTSARSVAPSDSTDLSARLQTGRTGVEVTGRLSSGTSDTMELSVQDPLGEAGSMLARILRDRGIRLDSDVRVRRTQSACFGVPRCPEAIVLATLESPVLMEIVEGVLEPSQNWMAEQLVHRLGLVESGRAGWSTGTRAVRRILQSDFGLDSLDLVVRDGSGLSAYNLVTPEAMVALLVGVHRRPWAAAFARAMAEPGEDDSTLAQRLEGLEGRVFAKTGTITHVNSLSGYVDTVTGRRLAFSVLTNGSGLRSSQVRAVIDRAVRLLAEFEGT